MEPEIDNKFSWSGFFFVTACSCFLFSLALKIMEGQFAPWLLLIAAVSAVMGVFSLIVGAAERQHDRRKRNKRFASSDF